MKCKMFDFLKPKKKTTEELQAELKALVDTVTVTGFLSYSHKTRYESLLREIYLRKSVPDARLKREYA